MGSTPQAPASVSATDIANAQTTANTTAQGQSLINQYNPYGSLTYTQTGSINGQPTYSANQTLSQPQQQIFNNYQQYQTGAGSTANSLLSQFSNSSNNVGQATSDLTNQLVGQYTASQNPQFQYQTQALEAQLANQGLSPDSVAYQQQLKNLQLNQNQSIQAFTSQIEPQAYSQAVSQYELPEQLAAQLAGQGNPTSLTNTLANTSAGQVSPANIAQAYQAQNQNYQNQLQAAQQQNSAIGGLVTGGLSLLGGGGGGGSLLGLLGNGGSNNSLGYTPTGYYG